MMKSVKRLVFSGIVIAVYINLMYLTQFLSFGQIRIRLADCVYGLCYIYPFLVLPMGIANFLSCLFFSGIGLIDMIGWMAVGILTAAGVGLVKKLQLNEWHGYPYYFRTWAAGSHMVVLSAAFEVCNHSFRPVPGANHTCCHRSHSNKKA